jgi:HD-like signal output (HDOD) protein
MAENKGIGFVNRLARHIAQGGLEIACFPDVATTLLRSIESERVTVPTVAPMIESEPSLSVRVVGLANSAAYLRAGRAVTDVRSAVVRIGLRSLRAAILAFAVTTLRDRPELKLVQSRIGAVWQGSVSLATLSQLLAMRVRGMDSEAALLGGLMQGVGQICLLSEAAFDVDFRENVDGLDNIVAQWNRKALSSRSGTARHSARVSSNWASARKSSSA